MEDRVGGKPGRGEFGDDPEWIVLGEEVGQEKKKERIVGKFRSAAGSLGRLRTDRCVSRYPFM
jgi:hypothetical protein